MPVHRATEATLDDALRKAIRSGERVISVTKLGCFEMSDDGYKVEQVEIITLPADAVSKRRWGRTSRPDPSIHDQGWVR